MKKLVSRLILNLFGWKVVSDIPTQKKYVIIVSPHTSNWDFLMFLYAILSKRVQPNVMGKHTLFWWPLSAIMSFLGVVPIDRTQKGGVVEQGIEYFNSVDKTIILVTPEGTRSYRKDWKSGFYHIAWGAKVPLILCKVNFHTRTIFIGEEFNMTGDYDKDIVGIKEYYKDCVPLKPENFGI